MPNRWSLIALTSLCLGAAPVPPETRPDISALGMLRSVEDGPRSLPLRSNVSVLRDHWSKHASLWEAGTGRSSVVTEDGLNWRAIDSTLKLHDGVKLAIRQRFHMSADTVRVRVDVTSPADLPDLDTLQFMIELPVHRYGRSTVKLGDNAPALLPETFGTKELTPMQRTADVSVACADTSSLLIKLDRPVDVHLQDARQWKTDIYQLLLPLQTGPMRANATVSLGVELRASIPDDASPVTLTAKPDERHQAFDGFGGNFVYGIRSPIVDRTLGTLTPGWARTSAELIDWDLRHHEPNANLKTRFALDQRLAKATDGRLILSVWHVPERFYAEPRTDASHPRSSAGTIPRERWPELVDLIASYLHELKRQGVEPALFSFNESDWGVYVKLNGEELRDLTRLLGQRFEKEGLKTRLLLGDSSSLRAGIEQIRPTLADAETMRYVGALGYHPWTGEAAYWPAWREAAERAGVPLLVTEMGSDADAWRDNSFHDPRNFVVEAARFVDLLDRSGASAILQWEWSDDYALTEENGTATPRLDSMKQFANTVPNGARVATIANSKPDDVSAALLIGEKPGVYTLHLVNRFDARTVRVDGLPAGVAPRVLIASPDSAAAPEFKNTAGRREVRVPARSHLTITTVP
ncbi:MAG: hypothetical protein QM770_23365 [Tepidisphaeraceae bacterium]